MKTQEEQTASIIKQIKESLHIEIENERAGYYDEGPGTLRITLYFDDEEISSSTCYLKETK